MWEIEISKFWTQELWCILSIIFQKLMQEARLLSEACCKKASYRSLMVQFCTQRAVAPWIVSLCAGIPCSPPPCQNSLAHSASCWKPLNKSALERHVPTTHNFLSIVHPCSLPATTIIGKDWLWGPVRPAIVKSLGPVFHCYHDKSEPLLPECVMKLLLVI